MSEIPTILIVNAVTDEVIEREMTDKEYAEFENDIATIQPTD